MGDIEETDLTKLKVPDLKKALKAKGLSTGGNKSDLIERLQKSMKLKMDDTASGVSVDDLEEDLLNDDDDEHIDTSESVIQDLDSALDVSIISKKRKTSETDTDQNKIPKKVILNRTSTTEENNSNGIVANEDIEKKDAEKKVVKLSELSAAERLEMRTKKFGVAPSVDAKKIARAERFNLSAKQTPLGGNVTTNIDVLKKRAERFGGSVSTIMSKLEVQEKLEKRKVKFGVATNSSNGSLQSEKAKQRLERFKGPVK